MSDLISRQAAIDALTEYGNGRAVFISVGEAVIRMEQLPSAQPEITHCAECIHWKHSDVRKNYCEVFDWVNKAEDFCSFAERKENR